MSSTKYCIVFNASNNAYVLDDETGKQILPGEFSAAQRSKISEHVADNELVIVDAGAIGDESSAGAKQAKADCEQLTAQWEAEKAGAEPKDLTEASDYDDSSTSRPTTKTTKSPKTTN